jgi:hypothetical protein
MSKNQAKADKGRFSSKRKTQAALRLLKIWRRCHENSV